MHRSRKVLLWKISKEKRDLRDYSRDSRLITSILISNNFNFGGSYMFAYCNIRDSFLHILISQTLLLSFANRIRIILIRNLIFIEIECYIAFLLIMKQFINVVPIVLFSCFCNRMSVHCN